MFDPIKFKKSFPLFSLEENRSLVYLDNAATTQTPQCVIDRIVDFYLRENGNANRASHRLARTATAMMEGVRQQVADFLGAASKSEIVFTSGATAGINLLASGLTSRLNTGDEVLLSNAEHHANLVPWQEAAKAQALQLVFCNHQLGDIKDKITSKTKIISVLAASNVLGKKHSLRLFKEIKQDYPDVILILDASQIIGHGLINLQDNFCDFLVCSAHKFYGPTGIGILYGRYEQLLKVRPSKFGGEMIQKVSQYSSSYTDAPYIFEAGTSSLAAIAGLGACITYLATMDLVAIAEHENQLTNYLHEKLFELINIYTELTLLTSADSNIGIAAIASSQCSMADIGFWLDEMDVAVRVGDHCAQPLLSALGVESILRVSIAAYNTNKDIDDLCQYLQEFLNENRASTKKIQELTNHKKSHTFINREELLASKSWKDRYKIILMSGKSVPKKNHMRADKNLVAGCESKLWITFAKEVIRNEVCYFFTVDSDSNIVKGLANLILCQVNGMTKEEIKAVDFETYFHELGLLRHLSESRVNGVVSMLQHIRSC